MNKKSTKPILKPSLNHKFVLFYDIMRLPQTNAVLLMKEGHQHLPLLYQKLVNDSDSILSSSEWVL